FGCLKTRTGADLAPEQAEAVKVALTQKVAVLTGGPGCGKSFTVRSVVELARARQAKVVLAAPTGRGAPRLGEPSRQAPGRADRVRGGDHPPAAEAAARRRPGVRR